MSVGNIRSKQQQHSFGQNCIYKHPIFATTVSNESRKEIQMAYKNCTPFIRNQTHQI